MPDTSVGLYAMPGPSSSRAPPFSREAMELLEFFEDFEDFVGSCSLTNREMVLKYVDLAINGFWIPLPGYALYDFALFKTSIFKQNPSATKGIQYTFCDLECIVLANADLEISTEMELMNYYF